MAIPLEENETNSELVAIGRNLSALMLKNKIETKSLSALTGISISLLNALKRGEGNPTLGTLIALAKYFDVSIDDLMSLNKTPPESVRIIPIYSLQDIHDLKNTHVQQNLYLQITDSSAENLFATTLNNTSMTPFFDKGSTFIISPDKKYIDGDILLVRINNERNVFRKVFLANKNLLFQNIAINSDLHSYDHFKVLGTVIKVIHELGNAHD